MDRVERLAEEIAAERYRNVRALFLRRGARPPFLLWRPREVDLPARPLMALMRWWAGLPRASALPPAQDVDPALLGSAAEHLVLVDWADDRRDFVYRHYGAALVRAFGRDLRGQRVSDYGGHIGLFVAAVYRAARLRREPIYAAHEPASELVTQSARVVLPMAQPDGSIGRLAVASVPEAPFRTLLETVMDGVLVFDGAGIVYMANAPAAAMLGYPEERLVGRDVAELISADFLDAGAQGRDGMVVTAAREALARRADGRAFAVEVSVGRTRHERRPMFVAVLRDVSARKAAEDRYRELALRDPLTGLANRLVFEDRFAQALARTRRARTGLALFLIDLDAFKAVNDRLGHLAGDLVLQEFARRVRGLTREADVLARLGGDEFALVQTDLDRPDGGVQALADRLLAALADPFPVDGERLPVGASVGVAAYPEDGDDTRSLLERADQALYAAKARGGRCCVRFGRGGS
jgi:diguanylate cyclase (GGDEF)-like protein/PAS domain S-box-containing protein